MTNETKHTPIPWEVATDEDGRVAVIKGCSFLTYAFPTDLGFETGSPEANAAHIVKCVNMHDELVEALKEVHDWFMADDAHPGSMIGRARETLKKSGAL